MESNALNQKEINSSFKNILKPFFLERLFLYLRFMKKYVFGFSLLLIMTSCSSRRDRQFCECLAIGDELNNHSAELLKGEVTKGQAEELKILKDKKKEACAAYENMSGPEMLKRKSECGE